MTSLENSVIYHLYPLGALGASIRGERRAGRSMDALTPWLDYIAELGCTTLLLGPIFQSVGHGYDTLDHFAIDDRLGGDEAFDTFVAECRERGIDVLLDGVFNHVAVTHRWVSEGGPIKRNAQGNPVGWEGHGELAEIDHADPRAAEEVTSIMRHWLDRGIAGWRLDVAYAVPTELWQQVSDQVRQTHPHAVFIGEVIHGDYAHIRDAGHLNAVTQYELWKAIWGSIKDKNFFELEHALKRHMEFGPLTQTFVGNHDVDRIASIVGDGGAKVAAVLLMTLPGIPSIYYGDEQAFRGERGEGESADDAVRPVLPELPSQLSTDGEWLKNIYQRLVGMRRREAWITKANVEVTEVANERIAYRVGDGFDVEVWLEPEAGAKINGELI